METENQISPKIFVVEDDPFYLNIVKHELQKNNFTQVTGFTSGEDCIKNLSLLPDVVLLDYSLQSLNGMQVLKKVKKVNPNIQVIFLTAQEKLDVAVSSLKLGAFDYVVKNESALGKIIKLVTKAHNFKKEADKKRTKRKIKLIVLVAVVAIILAIVIIKFL